MAGGTTLDYRRMSGWDRIFYRSPQASQRPETVGVSVKGDRAQHAEEQGREAGLDSREAACSRLYSDHGEPLQGSTWECLGLTGGNVKWL